MDLIYDPFDESDSNASLESNPRRYRHRFDFDKLTDDEVIENFRLKRETILILKERIAEPVESSYRNRQTDLSPLFQLLISLR